ncbi:MAG: hypothetical protein WDA75_20215, partial [Candidatus Latescibacterota bacterium]
MRRRRTIYFNDARHYYLFVFEPPMRLEEAWVPIDEVAGTAVDTFIYGVARGDGLFYPSEVGLRFGADQPVFRDAPYWRVWENMQSLLDRGLDPLQVLVDRAHEKGLEFFASLRMGGFDGKPPELTVAKGGRGYADPEARAHQLAMVTELATRYPVEGVELDFAAAPGGCSFYLRPEDLGEHTPTLTEFVRQAADRVRHRPGSPGQVGARVYPSEELNRRAGLDVRTWLDQGLVDFVVPVVYASMILDADMPIAWLVEAAHAREISVYGMLQPYYESATRANTVVTHASAAMVRAAAGNLWDLGVDGLYTWFLAWPLGERERSILTELGDPELTRHRDKHYFVRRRLADHEAHDLPFLLPLPIPQADPARRYAIPFSISDDLADDRVQRVRLRLGVTNLVSADRLAVWLNGVSLDGQTTRRDFLSRHTPYTGQWLEIELQTVRPCRGRNTVEVALLERPARFAGGVTLEDVEVLVDYGPYPAG